MPTNKFKSPGFFDNEIDLTQPAVPPFGVSAGIIGTAKQGPAFVPVTVSSFNDFKIKFCTLDHKKYGPYAVNEFLKNRNAITYVRVLGAGAADSSTDVDNTRAGGIVKNAGFKIQDILASSKGAPATELRHAGAVQFIVAKHLLSASEALGYPLFTDNDSFNSTGKHTDNDTVNVVRAMLFATSGTRIMLMDGNQNMPASFEGLDDLAGYAGSGETIGKFKIAISSSNGAGFSTADDKLGVRIFTASLDPSNSDYISKVLNTDPEKFYKEEHLLYADFAVEEEIATVSYDANSIAILSGTALTSATAGISGIAFRNLFGRFDTRFQTPKTTNFISQPFGDSEYNLFYFESISDGAYANDKFKISISNLRGSVDQNNPYGTFTVLVRSFDDTDTDPEILEQYPLCSLNPNSDNYVAKLIGDKKVYYNFDTDSPDERRLIVKGKYPNKSRYVRITMASDVEDQLVPAKSLPFGFRGLELPKTSETLTDGRTGIPGFGISNPRLNRLGGVAGTGAAAQAALQDISGSILPPIPFRFKITKGETKNSLDDGAQLAGNPGVSEIVDGRLYWGVKFERVPYTGSMSNAVLNPNASSVKNPLIENYTKFLGISKLDALVTGSAADAFNNNKFTLARVALSNATSQYNDTELTGSAETHIREAAYIRNGVPDPTEYKITDGVTPNRITLATLLAQTSSITFNKFSDYAKFSTFLYGGFDGVNILDKHSARLNDRGASSDTDGGASSAYASPGLQTSAGGTTNVAGTGRTNNSVFSYNSAISIMTDPMVANINLLAIPGIRDSFVTDNASAKTKEYGLAMYVMDNVGYSDTGERLFDDTARKPDANKTAEQFETKAIDNNYVATYFPDVVITDEVNNRKVKVPSSIAALAALGFNDRISYPWFAPAGFNRGALDFVSNTDVRLSADDRDRLYDAKINPIASFPNGGFVIFGQKTLQQARSALDRVNVRRLLLEVKRLVINVAQKIVFEQNTPGLRAKFIKDVTPLLAIIQAQAGIEKFKIVMDNSNNTEEDVNSNRLNGRIVVVPTRAIEFIAVDFIVTNAGVSFK